MLDQTKTMFVIQNHSSGGGNKKCGRANSHPEETVEQFVSDSALVSIRRGEVLILTESVYSPLPVFTPSLVMSGQKLANNRLPCSAYANNNHHTGVKSSQLYCFMVNIWCMRLMKQEVYTCSEKWLLFVDIKGLECWFSCVSFPWFSLQL